VKITKHREPPSTFLYGGVASKCLNLCVVIDVDINLCVGIDVDIKCFCQLTI
jgi:hypothetical protein